MAANLEQLYRVEHDGYVVSHDELVRLLKRSDRLEALERGGVDNWDWYHDSLKDHGYYVKWEE